MGADQPCRTTTIVETPEMNKPACLGGVAKNRVATRSAAPVKTTMNSVQPG